MAAGSVDLLAGAVTLSLVVATVLPVRRRDRGGERRAMLLVGVTTAIAAVVVDLTLPAYQGGPSPNPWRLGLDEHPGRARIQAPARTATLTAVYSIFGVVSPAIPTAPPIPHMPPPDDAGAPVPADALGNLIGDGRCNGSRSAPVGCGGDGRV